MLDMTALENELIALIQRNASLREIGHWAHKRGVDLTFSMPEAEATATREGAGSVYVNGHLARDFNAI
jgi:hypothetical protein